MKTTQTARKNSIRNHENMDLFLNDDVFELVFKDNTVKKFNNLESAIFYMSNFFYKTIDHKNRLLFGKE